MLLALLISLIPLLFDLERGWQGADTIEPIYAHKLANVVIEAFRRGYGSKVIKKSYSKNDPRLITVATEIVKDGMLDSASPSPEEDVDGWYDATADHWVERTNNFFEIVEYFGHIICVSEEIYNFSDRAQLESKTRILETTIHW